jgi:hypothetical protein
MLKDEIIQRLERIAKHATHIKGEEPYVMSLDDGVAILDAIDMIKTKDTVETCVDRVSRQTALDAILSIIAHADEAYNAVLNLPPAQPEPTMEEFMYGQDMGNPEDGSL